MTTENPFNSNNGAITFLCSLQTVTDRVMCAIRVLTTPVYLWFLWVLWRNRAKAPFNTSFFRLLGSLGVTDLLSIGVAYFSQSPLPYVTGIRLWIIASSAWLAPLLNYVAYSSVFTSG